MPQSIFVISIECPVYGDRIWLPKDRAFLNKEDCEKEIAEFERLREEQFKITKEHDPSARRGKKREMKVKEIFVV